MSNKKTDSIQEIANSIDEKYLECVKLLSNHPQKAFELAKEIYKTSEKILYWKGMAYGLQKIGVTSYLIGNIEEAIDASMNAMKLSTEIGESECTVIALNTMGMIYDEYEQTEVALNFYYKALKVAEENNIDSQKVRVYNNIGEVYRRIRDYDEALKNYYLAIDSDKEKTDYIYYINIALIWIEKGDFEKAIKFSDMALRISIQQNATFYYGSSLRQLGEVYDKIEKHEKALEYIEEAIKVFEIIDSRVGLFECMLAKSNIYCNQKKYEESLSILSRLDAIVQELENHKFKLDLAEAYVNLWEKNGDTNKALEYIKYIREVEKSFFKDDTTKKFNALKKLSEIECNKYFNEKLTKRDSEILENREEINFLNKKLDVINKIGWEFTSIAHVKTMMTSLYEHLETLMDITYFGIGLLEEDKKTIDFKYSVNKEKNPQRMRASIEDENSLSAWCYNNKKEVFVNSYEEVKNYVNHKEKNIFGERPDSIMFCPLVVDGEALGVITVQSIEKDMYSKEDLEILRVLASFTAIALGNMQKSEKLQNEINERKLLQEKLEEVNKKLFNLAKYDGLTEIYNRRTFDELIEKEYKDRAEERSISVLIIDIDYFKQFNDNYGHLLGDECIKLVAATIQKNIPKEIGFLARYGGDEFIICLNNTSIVHTKSLAEKIRKAVEDLNIKHEYSKVLDKVTITLGGAVFRLKKEVDFCIIDMFSLADKCLYDVKVNGRNKVLITEGN